MERIPVPRYRNNTKQSYEYRSKKPVTSDNDSVKNHERRFIPLYTFGCRTSHDHPHVVVAKHSRLHVVCPSCNFLYALKTFYYTISFGEQFSRTKFARSNIPLYSYNTFNYPKQTRLKQKPIKPGYTKYGTPSFPTFGPRYYVQTYFAGKKARTASSAGQIGLIS